MIDVIEKGKRELPKKKGKRNNNSKVNVLKIVIENFNVFNRAVYYTSVTPFLNFHLNYSSIKLLDSCNWSYISACLVWVSLSFAMYAELLGEGNLNMKILNMAKPTYLNNNIGKDEAYRC